MKTERRLWADRVKEVNEKAERRGLQCPKCGGVQFGTGKHVLNTIPADGCVERRRECPHCQHVFYTREQ
jgi:transcriptional regulator NrdR family protein